MMNIYIDTGKTIASNKLGSLTILLLFVSYRFAYWGPYGITDPKSDQYGTYAFPIY